MDRRSLKQLSRIADILHEQNAARLTAAQQALTDMRAKRSELLRRPGVIIGVGTGDATSVLAQSMWINSVAAVLPAIDKNVDDLEAKVNELTTKTRLSFTKVRGFESLSENRKRDDRVEDSKRDETAQDMLIALRRSSST